MATIKVGPKEEDLKSTRQKVLNKFLWLFGTARNAILLVLCGSFSYYLGLKYAEHPFKTIGDIPAGLPSFQVPKFSLNSNESTTGEEESFGDMLGSMGSGIIVVPLLAVLENISICKAFGEFT